MKVGDSERNPRHKQGTVFLAWYLSKGCVVSSGSLNRLDVKACTACLLTPHTVNYGGDFGCQKCWRRTDLLKLERQSDLKVRRKRFK